MFAGLSKRMSVFIGLYMKRVKNIKVKFPNYRDGGGGDGGVVQSCVVNTYSSNRITKLGAAVKSNQCPPFFSFYLLPTTITATTTATKNQQIT